MNKIIKKINEERQTVKAYSNKKISTSNWKEILSAIYWSPTSHGFEPYRVLTISKENPIREKLKPIMWNQGTIIEADKLIVFISLKHSAFTNKKWLYERSLRRATKIGGLKGEEAKDAAKKAAENTLKSHLDIQETTDDWSMKQSYIGLSFGLVAATILGIGSQSVEGFDRIQVENLLKSKKLITKDERVSIVATFGYPKSKTAYAHYGKGTRVRDDWKDKFQDI